MNKLQKLIVEIDITKQLNKFQLAYPIASFFKKTPSILCRWKLLPFPIANYSNSFQPSYEITPPKLKTTMQIQVESTMHKYEIMCRF